MRYLGLDLGTKTIGLAISDKTGLIEDKLRTFLKNNNVNADAYIQSIKNFKQPDQDSMPLDLTFSDGAQWTYFGQIEKVPMSVLNGAVIQKRISSINPL